MRNFLAILVFTAILTAGPPPALRLKTQPNAGFEPAKIHVELYVVPEDADYAIGVTLAGPDYYRTSEWSGDGVRMQRLYTFDFRDVPAGEYRLTAKLASRTAVRAMDVKPVNVQERGH